MIQSRRVRPTTALRRTQSSTTPMKPSFKSEGVDFARKYGFRQLLDSPLPSPALPSLTPRHGKTPPPHRVRHALRVLLRLGTWLCGVSLVYWIASTVLGSSELPAAVSYVSSNGRTYEFAADDSISFAATPVVVTDRRGKARWTVSIPPSLDFPLRPGDYANICQRAGKVSERLRGVKGGPASTEGSVVYDHNDPTFMDIQEAEQDGLLPAASENAAGPSRRPVALEVEKRFKDENQMSLQHESRNGICERSLTYVMETVDAGLGKTLMGLWMSYGLAKEEGRAFFIDDTNWYLQCSDASLYVTNWSIGHMANIQPSSNHLRSPLAIHHHHLTVFPAHIKPAISFSPPPPYRGPLVVLLMPSIKTSANQTHFANRTSSLSSAPATTPFSISLTPAPTLSPRAFLNSTPMYTPKVASPSAFTSATVTATLGSSNTRNRTSHPPTT